MNYKTIIVLSILLILNAANGYCADPAATTADSTQKEAIQEPATAQPADTQADTTTTSTATSQTQDEDGMTLKAEKVPVQAANTAGQQSQIAQTTAPQQPYQQQAPYMPPKTKKVPIYLQPFEFVISSVVNALTFWQKGDELNKPVWERGKKTQ